MQLSLLTDRSLIRAGARSTRYLMVSITAPVAPARATRTPISVGFVLDRSGSMDGAHKFELARSAVEQALRLLRPEDRFTLVIYDEEVETLVPATLATAEARRLAMQKLARVGPRGSTDLHSGWATGAHELAAKLSRDAVNRVLLLTDGLANHGITDAAQLSTFAAELRASGIATTTFGVGEDFDEQLLRDISHEGGGQFYFIETPPQIADFLTSELGEALEIVRRDAVLRISLPAGAEVRPLNRYRHDAPVAGELRVHLGDLASGQELKVVLRVRFARGEEGEQQGVGVAIEGDDALLVEGARDVTWRYAGHAENDAQPRTRVVDREVATLYAARARAEATDANRHHDFDRARRVIEETATRIEQYAGSDRELRRIARELRDEIVVYAEAPMSAMSLKASFFVAESAVKNRTSSGRSRRAT